MSSKDRVSEFKDLETENCKRIKDFNRKGYAILKITILELFEELPDLNFIILRSNIPWNDGDVCSFDMHGIYAKLKTPTTSTDTSNPSFDDVEDEIEDEDRDWLDSYDSDLPKALKAEMNQLERGLESILSSLEIIFGGDVRVVITKDGVETEDYSDHD